MGRRHDHLSGRSAAVPFKYLIKIKIKIKIYTLIFNLLEGGIAEKERASFSVLFAYYYCLLPRIIIIIIIIIINYYRYYSYYSKTIIIIRAGRIIERKSKSKRKNQKANDDTIKLIIKVSPKVKC